MDLEGLLGAGCGSALKVGLGGPSVSRSMMEGLRSRGCRVNVLSCPDPGALVRSLYDGRVDAAVRGTLASSAVMAELKQVFGLKVLMRAAVLEDSSGKPFVLAPVGIDEGMDISSRLELAKEAVSYFSAVGWELSVGVLSKGRIEDLHRGEEIRLSIEEGEKIVQKLRGSGLRAEHRAILVEDAVGMDDLVIAPDGVSGNLMFRTLHFVGGRNAYGAPVVNLPKVFVDTSRAKPDFTDAVLLAAGLVASRSRARPRA